MGFSFNQCLDNLPSSIVNLTLDYSFNKPINNLPSFIISLTLGNIFNQCLDNLPSSINKITFKSCSGLNTEFNLEIKKIPPNLTLVDLSKIYDKSHLKKEFGKFNIEIIE